MQQEAARRWVAWETPLEIGEEAPLEVVVGAPLELAGERERTGWHGLGRMLPVLEEVAELAYGVKFFVDNSGGGLFEGDGEGVEGMEESIFVRDGWMREVVVAEFNSVGDEEGFGGGVNNL